MFDSIEKQAADAFHAHIQARYGVDLSVAIEQPRQSDFGEIAVPAAFQLAKQLRQPPKKIAAELAAEIGPIAGVAAVEVAGNGYINIRLDRGAYAAALLRGEAEGVTAAGGKIIVEHTNINPNKAAHIGHLRNATLGDTFVRMLRASGARVEVQNYIDNTGVQVADVVVGFHYLRHKTPADVRAMLGDPAVRFDYYCWDLYAYTSSYYTDHPEALEWRTTTLHAIEAGSGELAELAHLVADAIVEAHLATMLRLDVEYDVLPRESEILHLDFWAAAFELLKQRKAIYFENEGKHAGCWVMPGLSEDGKVIVPGDSKKSLLVIAAAQIDDETAMPPKRGPGRGGPRGPGGPPPGDGGGPGGPGGPGSPGGPGGFGPPPKPLTAEQVGMLRAWVDQGAK